jgi:hypothetical protein
MAPLVRRPMCLSLLLPLSSSLLLCLCVVGAAAASSQRYAQSFADGVQVAWAFDRTYDAITYAAAQTMALPVCLPVCLSVCLCGSVGSRVSVSLTHSVCHRVTLEVPQAVAWVGFGLSTTGGMAGADFAIAARLADGGFSVTDRTAVSGVHRQRHR